MNEGNANRVFKNTMALYIRMIVLTLISLFTYRVIIGVLGASNYGTYNVVGGFVTMFSFVSGTMTISSQRYFAMSLAEKNWYKLNKSFSVNIAIYVLLSFIIFILAETVGLWFVLNKLNLDYSRIWTIVIVYETSVAVMLIGLFVSPFLALLVADENLSIYSWISIIEGILKIVVAYLLYALKGEKLEIYSFLLLGVSVLINGFYIMYCKRKYKQLKFKFCKDKNAYKDVFSFINWNLIGAVASVGKNQGINIIINIFFGTVVNAARAIGYQLSSIISSFAQNFMKAVDPQITKAYALKDEDSFISIIYTSSKLSYYLLLFIALPFITNVQYVLTLWLGEVPQYTVVFTVFALIDALILSITDPILTGVQSVGKMRNYQLTTGIISLMNLPISYFALKIGDNPVIPFIIAIVLDVFITLGRLINFKRVYQFSIWKYCKNIFGSIFVITVIASILDKTLFSNADNLLQLMINVAGSVMIMVVLIYFIGLNKSERSSIKGMIPFMKKRIL